MTVRPDFGPEYGEDERRSQGVLPASPDDVAEREVQEHAAEEREIEYLEPEDNEAHAPGKVCERCGAVITASQDARRLPDGQWIHEVCPPDLSGLRLGDEPGQDRKSVV